ncbi:unnamed protein product [Moneuplotes crassus]|uniref:Uncharacterized protein n=1 Tax=Euplotes crassus TaxID=5936 RepID=A0AAD1X9S7_EUPCR|nr:unnamed protein product [Moneuplotes crassus]
MNQLEGDQEAAKGLSPSPERSKVVPGRKQKKEPDHNQYNFHGRKRDKSKEEKEQKSKYILKGAYNTDLQTTRTKTTKENYQRDKKLQREFAKMNVKSSISKKVRKNNENTIRNLKISKGKNLHREKQVRIGSNNAKSAGSMKQYSTISSMKASNKAARDRFHKRLSSNLMETLQDYISICETGSASMVENRIKRTSGKFQSKRDQDLVIERLLKQKEKIENNKKLLETTYRCEQAAKDNIESKVSHNVQQKPRSRPNFENFYKDQVNRELERKIRLATQAEHRRKRELSYNKKPSLSSKTRKLASSMERKGSIHDRLHQTSYRRIEEKGHNAVNSFMSKFSLEVPLSSRKANKRFHSAGREDCTFHPKISERTKNIQYSQSFGDRLFSDATQRRDRREISRLQEVNKIKESKVVKNSSKSSQLAYKKFSRDFRNALKNNRRVKDKLNFLDLCNLMIDLHMIDTKLLNTNKSDEERELIREIWRLLGGENEEDEIPTISVRNFICIILNFDLPFLYFPSLDSLDANQFDQNTVGIISAEGIFFLRDKKEIKKIHKSFYVFCLNRFNNLSGQKSERSRSLSNRRSRRKNRDFIPKINSYSKMIDRRNNRSCDRRENMLLNAGKKYIEVQNQKSLEKQSHELDSCTFFPDTEKLGGNTKINTSDTGFIKSSIISEQSMNLISINSEQQQTQTTNDKFLQDLAKISPINRSNVSSIALKHKSHTVFPYKPLPEMDSEGLAEKAQKESSQDYGIQGNNSTQETQKENDDDEVVFKTNSSLEDFKPSKGSNNDLFYYKKPTINDVERSIRENSLEKISPIKITTRSGDLDDVADEIEEGHEIKIIEDPLSDKYEQQETYENFFPSTPNKKELKEIIIDEKDLSSPSQEVTNSLNEQEEEELSEEDSQIPLLFVDVNLGKGVMKRIILYEEDDPKYIAEMFAKDNKLEPNMKEKLETLLKKQMEGVLSKIDEDDENEESTSN